MSKKYILMTVIFLSISSAALCKEYKWVLSSETISNSAKNYYDINNIIRYGNKIKVWVLKDYAKPQTVGQSEYTYMSDIGSIVLDCNENIFEVKQFFEYSGKMGTGKIVYTSPYVNNDISSIPPGSIMDRVKDEFCNTK